MQTFDVAGTRKFAADLNLGMDKCDNGEGFECTTFDAVLINYAIACYRFSLGVNHWARAVFTGEAAFDHEVESTWLDEGQRLYVRASRIRLRGQKAEVPCYQLDGKGVLDLALRDLNHLLENWVTPKLAVAPSARRRAPLPDTVAEEARRRIASLPPLPPDWLPAADPEQGCVHKES